MNLYFQAHKRRNQAIAVDPSLNYPVGESITSGWVFSLRRWYGWTGAFIRVRRSSDNAETNVFFAAGQYLLDLDNLTSSTSTTVAGTVTLGNWAGTDDVHIRRLYLQKEDGTFDSTRYLYDGNNNIANEAKILDAGNLIINSASGKPIAEFAGMSKYRPNGGGWGRLGGTSSCTLVVVAANTVVNSRQTPLNTNRNLATSGEDRMALQMDNRTTLKRMFLIRVDNVSYIIDQDNFNTNTDLQVLSMTKDATQIRGWLDGVEQGSAVSWSGTFEPTPSMVIGWDAGNYFTGEFFEAFTTNQNEATAGNISEMHTLLNNYLN